MDVKQETPEAVPTANEVSIADRLVEYVYRLILGVTVGTWTVVGFLVWVPLLIRTTTILAGTVFYSTLFRDQPRVNNAQRGVHFAVSFYPRGFDHFIEFYRHRHDIDARAGLLEPLSTMKWKELLVECGWVVGAWGATYLVLHGLVRGLFGA